MPNNLIRLIVGLIPNSGDVWILQSIPIILLWSHCENCSKLRSSHSTPHPRKHTLYHRLLHFQGHRAWLHLWIWVFPFSFLGLMVKQNQPSMAVTRHKQTSPLILGAMAWRHKAYVEGLIAGCSVVCIQGWLQGLEWVTRRNWKSGLFSLLKEAVEQAYCVRRIDKVA